MRAAIYLRISEDRSGAELGVIRQGEDCEKLVALRGWTLERPPFTDNDISAAGKKNRPAFNALIDEITAGNIDVVVAWTLDRLSRNARDQLALVEACQQHSVTIALVRGSDMDPTTPAGRLTLGVLGSVAAHEIDVKSDRTQRATQQAAAMGRWTGGRRPFGFEEDGVTIRPDEAEAIREAYEMVLTGSSLRSVVEHWSHLGLRSGQSPGESPRWRTTSVRRILENPRYAGIRSYRGEEYGQAVWPAIVPLEVYRAAQSALRRQPQGPPRRQLLSGLARCGNPLCQHMMHASINYRGDAIYRCSSSTDHKNTLIPPAAGPHPNRRAQPCDDFVTSLVVARLSQPDAWELLVDDDKPLVAELRTEAVMLQRRLDQLAQEFAEQVDVSLREYRLITQATRERLSEVELRLVSVGRNRVLSQLVHADDVLNAWNDLDLAQRRVVIKDLMYITLHPVGVGARKFREESVQIEWTN